MNLNCELRRLGCEGEAVGAYRLAENKAYTSFCASCWRAVRDRVLAMFCAVPLQLGDPLPSSPQLHIRH